MVRIHKFILVLMLVLLLGSIVSMAAAQDPTQEPTQEPNTVVIVTAEATEAAVVTETQPDGTVVIELPPAAETDFSDYIIPAAIILSLVGTGVSLAVSDFKRTGNVHRTVDNLVDNAEFHKTVRELAQALKDSAPPRLVAAMSNALGAGYQIADTVEDGLRMGINAFRPTGQARQYQFDMDIPEGVDPELVRATIEKVVTMIQEGKDLGQVKLE